MGDLPVPCSYSRIFLLSARPHRVHRLSWLPSGWCKSELCTAGTQSRDWAPGRTASSFSKRRCGPSSPTFNPTLLLLLLLDQANNQTSLLAEQDSHRNTTIRAKTLTERERKRGREGGRNGAPKRKIYTLSSNLCFPHGRVGSLRFVCPLSLFLSPFFPPRRRRKRTCLRAVRLCARVLVRLCARGAPQSWFLLSTNNSDVGRSAHRAFMWRNGYSASPQITSWHSGE